MNKIKEKNNLWLWFYRYNTSTLRTYPNLCPLAWSGLMGMVFFILSPIVNLNSYIAAKRKKITFLEQTYNEDNSGVGRFGINLLIVALYIFFVMMMASFIGPFESFSAIPNWIFYYGWVAPCVGLCLVLGLLLGLVYIGDNISDSDNVEILRSGIRSKYESMCPRIEWIKKENND